jgi:hypothetical protein
MSASPKRDDREVCSVVLGFKCGGRVEGLELAHRQSERPTDLRMPNLRGARNKITNQLPGNPRRVAKPIMQAVVKIG